MFNRSEGLTFLLNDMFKQITIKETSPRDLTSSKVSFSEGLRLKFFFGYFFLIGAAMLFLMSVIMFQMVAPAIVFAMLAGIGFFMISNVRKTVNLRKEIFNKGVVVRAKVQSQGRKFNPLKSNKDFTITVKSNIKEQTNSYTIKHSSEVLWEFSPIGHEIIGLYYDGNFLFGEEIACQFNFI